MLSDVLRRASVQSGVGIFTGHFTKQAANGNQDLDLSEHIAAGLPNLSTMAEPWALIVQGTGSQAVPVVSGAWENHIGASLGVAAADSAIDTVSQYAAGIGSTDNQATSNNGRRMAAKIVATGHPGGAGIFVEGSMGAIPFPTATTMRINWDAGSTGERFTFNYMLITGLEEAKAVAKQAGAPTGSQSYTGIGFPSDLIIFGGGNDTYVIPTTSAHARIGFGMANKYGQQAANAIGAADNVNPSATARWQQTDACFLGTHGADTTGYVEAKFKAITADGFDLYWITGAANFDFFALCLKGISSKIGAFTKTTAVAPAAQTVNSRQRFIPKGALFSYTQQDPTGSPAAGARWGLGVSDLTNERSNYLHDDNGISPTDANSIWYSNKAIASSDLNLADLTSVDDESFSLSWTASQASSREILYLLLGDAGTDTFPHQITTPAYSNNAASTSFSNQKLAGELSTGRKWAAFHDTSSLYVYWSDDDFLTKTEWTGAQIAGFANGSIDSYVDSGGTERLVAVWKQSGTGGGRTNDSTYVMVGTFNADRTTLTWGTATSSGLGDTRYQYSDIIVHAEGTGGAVHVVSSFNASATDYYRYGVDSAGAFTSAGNYLQYESLDTACSLNTFPSIDYDPITKRLFVAWSAGTTGAGKGIRFRTASYSAGVWTWASEVDVDTTHYVYDTGYSMNCRWDPANSVVTIGGWVDTGAMARLKVWQSSNFTSFGTPIIDGRSADSALWLYNATFTHDAVGNLHIVGRGGGNVNYFKWTRVGASLSSGITTDHGAAYPFIFPITGGVGWIWTKGNNAPYAVVYDQELT